MPLHGIKIARRGADAHNGLAAIIAEQLRRIDQHGRDAHPHRHGRNALPGIDSGVAQRGTLAADQLRMLQIVFGKVGNALRVAGGDHMGRNVARTGVDVHAHGLPPI